jgi:uncharacterized delta-60 repeat protein
MKNLIWILFISIVSSSIAQNYRADLTFNTGFGFDGIVYTTEIQSDGKIIVGGVFSSYNGNQTNKITRLNPDGIIDLTFNTGTGFDNQVNTTEIQSDGKIIVGGFFSDYNGNQTNNLTRLNPDGTIDLTFNTGTGFDGEVLTTKIQSDGKIIVGGEFSSYNGNQTNKITRLNPDGTIDLTFNTGTGFDNQVNTTEIQSDGKIIVGGGFSSYNGSSSNKIARLNADGTIDLTFNIGSGFSLVVYALNIQTDGKIIVGGNFFTFNGVSAQRVIRLAPDGSIDLSFNSGLSGGGLAQQVLAISIQSDGKIVMGGYYLNNYNGAPGYSLTRLNTDGTLDSSFDTGSGYNQVFVYSSKIQSDGKIIVGGEFYNYNGATTNRIARLRLCTNTPINQTINPTSCGVYTSATGQTFEQSGTYVEIIPNILGCDSIIRTINLTILDTNDNISITPNPAFGNAPLNVAFANQTANLSNYNFTWYFGDGTTQQSNAPFLSHIYTQDGYADVTVVAENLTTGCSSSQTFNDLIFVIGGVTCTHTATLNQTGPLSGCVGDSLLLSCNTDQSFTYQWNRNGIPVSGATSSSFYPTQSGSYTVTIYQNNCPVTSVGISVTFNPLPSVPTISSSGTITPCSGGSMTLTAPSGFSSYLWNTGSTASSLVVSQSGNYSVSVTNSNGCSQTSNPFAVNASFMAAPQVCIVGVDSLTNENRVVWEKPLTQGIDSFYVYKETNVSNVYTKIGATDYNDLAVFLDVNSNPAVQAYRYKISALDTCGVETNVGDFHKTIHLTINQGIGGAWNLIWSHYEGLNFGSYNIYRGTDPSNISLLTTIQSNLNSYSDLTPPTGPLYYQIEVVNPVNCDPTKIVNYGVSRSNIVNNGVSGVIEVVNTNILVYPNPTNGNITLEASSELVGKRYSIRDFSGRIILDGKISSTQEQIDLQNVARGAYYLSIENGSSVTKLIKQ